MTTGLLMFTVQRFGGNEYTHLLVLLYFMLLLPSIAFDRALQEKYFPHVQPLVFALRAVAIVLTLGVLCLYIITMFTPLGEPITAPANLHP